MTQPQRPISLAPCLVALSRPAPRGGATRRLTRSLALALAVVSGGATFGVGPSVAHARVVEKIAAVVGESIILGSEVEEKAAPLLAEVARESDTGQRAARSSALRHEVLERMIDDELILQEANELRLSVTSEQVHASIDEIKRQNNLDDDQLRQALAGQGMSMSTYRQDLKRQLLRFRVINIAVGSKVTISDEDVKNYYERHMKGEGALQVKASHIFLSIPENADASVVAARQSLGRKLVERVQKGEDFAGLAKEYSDDAATRAEGGDLGYFGKDMLPKPIEEMVFSMKPGDVRGPVRADRGFHVILLVDRRLRPAKPLDELKDDIRLQLRQREMDKQTKTYLADLRKKKLIDIRY